MAMRVGLSAKIKERSICVVEKLDWPGGKTKGLKKRLDELGWMKKVLFVCGRKVELELVRASGNLREVEVMGVEDVHVYDVVRCSRVVLDVAAVDWLEDRFGKLNAPLRVMPMPIVSVMEAEVGIAASS